tara:strand:- start:103 stop:597 length:495 start_codon:yes stop_codon:yes gene_type:complete
MQPVKNSVLIAALVGLGAAVIGSSSNSDGIADSPVYRMTYTDISKPQRGFHARALSSPDPELYGEGCVRTISEEEAQRFVSALRIGQPSQDDTITVEDAGVMSISDNNGRFAGPVSIYSARDFEGNIYETSWTEYLVVYRVGLQILLDNGCEDARYRLEINPYQ